MLLLHGDMALRWSAVLGHGGGYNIWPGRSQTTHTTFIHTPSTWKISVSLKTQCSIRVCGCDSTLHTGSKHTCTWTCFA
jgi:hypothetical protein